LFEAACVKDQWTDFALGLKAFDTHQNDLVVPGAKAVKDRTIEPRRRALDEDGSFSARLPLDASEPILGLGGELPARDRMSFAQDTRAKALGGL
jgi:hypothetical protein